MRCMSNVEPCKLVNVVERIREIFDIVTLLVLTNLLISEAANIHNDTNGGSYEVVKHP